MSGGVFVRACMDAMDQYRAFRSQGVSREDAIKGLETVLRDVWPKNVSKFPPSCDACEDTGYIGKVCAPYVRCERQNCQRHGEDWQHRYVVMCHCEKGEAFKRAELRKHAHDEPEITIGKVNKPQPSWKRLGT